MCSMNFADCEFTVKIKLFSFNFLFIMTAFSKSLLLPYLIESDCASHGLKLPLLLSIYIASALVFITKINAIIRKSQLLCMHTSISWTDRYQSAINDAIHILFESPNQEGFSQYNVQPINKIALKFIAQKGILFFPLGLDYEIYDNKIDFPIDKSHVQTTYLRSRSEYCCSKTQIICYPIFF